MKNKNCLLIGENSTISKLILPKINKLNYKIISTYHNKQKIHSKNSIHLDLSNSKSISFFIKKLLKIDIKFDLILFIAAVTPEVGRKKNSFLSKLKYKDFNRYMNVNCFSYITVIESLLMNKKLNENCKIFFFSSKAGSIESRGKLKHHLPGGDLLYRLSKSALNCAIKNIAFDLSNESYSFIAYHPGYITNDTINSIDYTNILFKMIKSNKKISGKFIDYEGKEIKW